MKLAYKVTSDFKGIVQIYATDFFVKKKIILRNISPTTSDRNLYEVYESTGGMSGKNPQ